MAGFIGFARLTSDEDTTYPTHRITNIGDKKVTYCDSYKDGHIIPSLYLKSIGDELVEYNKSWFSGNSIISIGGKPVKYNKHKIDLISFIGDTPVEYQTPWFGSPRLISIGDKIVKYKKVGSLGDMISHIGDEPVGYTPYPHEPPSFRSIVIAIMICAAILFLDSRSKC